MANNSGSNRSLWIRLLLGYLALQSLQLGVWALLAPQSFYDNFPGLGRSWVSVDGPFNEHLIRDVGALNLSLLVVLVWAAVTLSRPLINAAAVASLAWGVPHLLYHMFNTENLETSDITASLAGLAFFAALPIGVMVMARSLPTTGATIAPEQVHASRSA